MAKKGSTGKKCILIKSGSPASDPHFHRQCDRQPMKIFVLDHETSITGLALLDNSKRFVEGLENGGNVGFVDAVGRFDADRVGGHAATADENAAVAAKLHRALNIFRRDF